MAQAVHRERQRCECSWLEQTADHYRQIYHKYKVNRSQKTVRTGPTFCFLNSRRALYRLHCKTRQVLRTQVLSVHPAATDTRLRVRVGRPVRNTAHSSFEASRRSTRVDVCRRE